MKIVFASLIALSISLNAFSQKTATTSDGKKVILNDNGTWKYADGKSTAKSTTCKTNGCKKAATKNGMCATHQPPEKAINAKMVQCTVVSKGKRCSHTTFSPNKKCFKHGGN